MIVSKCFVLEEAGFSSDCSPQGSRMGAQPFRTAPPCVRPALSVFNSYIPSLAAFLGKGSVSVPCRFPCFPVATQWAQRKPPSDSVSMEYCTAGPQATAYAVDTLAAW